MELKFLHTSDWHLGKKLYRLDRLPEQEFFLAELLSILKSQKIDHLLVAGDIFDSPMPPHRALKVFFDFIADVIALGNVHLWVIGGNHDSGPLLEAPKEIIASERVHILGTLKSDPREHWFELPFPGSVKKLDLCLLPYFRHHELGEWKKHIQLDNLADFEDSVLKDFLNIKTNGVAKVFMGHHLFGSFTPAGSEQALALSGMESIPVSWLSNFDYAALGHIHRPQKIHSSKPLAVYSGSPIPMRLSETNPKEVSIITWRDDGSFKHEAHLLPVWRRLQTLQLNLSNWESSIKGVESGDLKTAIEVHLQLEAPLPGLIEKIRLAAEAHGVELLSVIPEFSQVETKSSGSSWHDLLKLTPEELFSSFYKSKYPESQDVPDDLLNDINILTEEIRHASPPA